MFSVSVKTPKESISYHCRGFFEPNWGLLCPLPSPQESLMLFLLISLPLSLTLPKWAHELRLLLFLLVQELAHSLWQWVKSLLGISPTVVCAKMRCVQRLENVAEVVVESSILDLPELALECVLEKLPPAALCSMAGVCRNFKERCWSDYLWESHMREKWGRVLGRSAKREWECHVSCRKNYLQGVERRLKPKSLIESISCIWPLSWIKPLFDSSSSDRPTAANPSPIDSIMSWYLALESGKFWFPAQVYNRENGHVGFVLSCYDAQLSYDRQTDTFYARYPPHGRKPVKMEEGIEWSRIRASPVDTSPHDLHVSDCLNDLRPGDHFEIQWRKSKEFPYGWWYGVVGHLESCDEREHHCCCHKDDTIILEFKQYAPGSKWRKTDISRKNHREKGDETDGFYGGIRKLQRKDEISIWKRFWPSEVLE